MFWKIRNTTLELGEKTYVMGIVNVTPDSFSDGGKYADPNQAVAHALELEKEGVDILDIGGQSTRPGHQPIPAEEEWRRIAPVLEKLAGATDLPISVDTYSPYVAERALEMGAHIINDVSGVITAEMAQIIVHYGAGWVIMHNAALDEQADVAAEVAAWMKKAIGQAAALGVPAEQICVDPGIGFGKNTAQNFDLIGQTAKIKPEGFAYLLGASRKRCIGALTGAEAENRDPGTIAAHTIGILGGVDILRVHDGAGGVQAAKIADAIMRGR